MENIALQIRKYPQVLLLSRLAAEMNPSPINLYQTALFHSSFSDKQNYVWQCLEKAKELAENDNYQNNRFPKTYIIAKCWQLKSRIFLKREQIDLVKQALKKAATAYPFISNVQFDLGNLYIKEKNYSLALRFFWQSHISKNTYAVRKLAEVYLLQNEKQKALDLLKDSYAFFMVTGNGEDIYRQSFFKTKPFIALQDNSWIKKLPK
jgi:tetratricopeptide (TPR) repeat protein